MSPATLTNLDWQSRQVGDYMLDCADFEHNGQVFTLVDTGKLFPDQVNWFRPTSEATGFAWHHDGVEYTGTTETEELNRVRVIYNYHVQQGWNGIGYHAVQGNSPRIYLPRKDVLLTHRAHVSTGASSTYRFPAAGDPNWNRQKVGFCIMGDYTRQGKPPQVMRSGADAFFKLATNTLGRVMDLHPHSWFQQKPCPGTWAVPESWTGVLYYPEKPDVDAALNVSVGGIQAVQRQLADLRDEIDTTIDDLQDEVARLQQLRKDIAA